MNFRQRLFKYLIGVGIGLLVSVMFFGDRMSLLTSWLPGNRVIDRLQETTWVSSPQSECLMDCMQLSADSLKLILEEANVDFGASETHEDPMRYVILFEENKPAQSLTFSVQDTLTQLISLQGLDCDCNE